MITDYIVFAETLREADSITAHQKKVCGGSCSSFADKYYRINPSSSFDRYGYDSSREYYENRYALPILTFKEWKEMITSNEISKPYRIKTEEEFIKEFGKDWRVVVLGVWVSPQMDIYFNTALTQEEYDLAQEIKLGLYDGESRWSISKDMVTDKPLEMEKKIIGYKIKKRFPGISELLWNSMQSTFRDSGYFFKNTGWAPVRDWDISDTEYFEPVYEAEKKYVEIIIGNPVKTIRITKNGTYWCQNKAASVLELEGFLNDLVEFNDPRIPWRITVTTGFKIGCSEFSIEQLRQVVETYKKEFGEKNQK